MNLDKSLNTAEKKEGTSMETIPMQMGVSAPSVFVAVTVFVVLIMSARAGGQLVLEVKEEPPDPYHVMIGGVPGRRYVGLLKNAGKSPVLVTIMQMRGRQIGSGRFRACYLERWNPISHHWSYTPGPVADVNTSDVTTVRMEAGSSVQACDALVSQEAGLCYRFSLQVQAKGSLSPSVLSRSFRVGTPADGNLPPSCGK